MMSREDNTGSKIVGFDSMEQEKILQKTTQEVGPLVIILFIFSVFASKIKK